MYIEKKVREDHEILVMMEETREKEVEDNNGRYNI